MAQQPTWFNKNLSIKTNPELALQIGTYLDGVANDKPENAKQLLEHLLHSHSATVSAQQYELLKEQLEEQEGKLHGLLQKVESLQAENQSLQTENEGLQAENQAVNNPQTIDKLLIKILNELLPGYCRPEDETPEPIFARLIAEFNGMNDTINRLDADKATLAQQLDTARQKRVDLATNELVVSFSEEQMANIVILRRIAEAVGHRFTNPKNPVEVIHYIMAYQLTLLRDMGKQLQKFEPITQILN